MRRTTLARPIALGACVVCVVVSFGAIARGWSLETGAEATTHAVRGDQKQVTATDPEPVGCHRVAVVGDSLMDNARPWLVSELAAAGFDAVVDAQPSRRIPASIRAPYSGVQAAASVRGSFGEADCWLIALGSNDLPYGGLDPAVIGSWLDEMLAAVSPGAHVWWVNLDYHHDSRWAFDFVRATTTFNTALASRAAQDPKLDYIDWYALAEANQQWFFDPVHVDRIGSIARAKQAVAALPRPA